MKLRKLVLLQLIYMCCSFALWSEDSFKDPYRGLDYEKLFDQSKILHSPHINRLSDQAINKLLVQDLLKKKQQVLDQSIKKSLFSVTTEGLLLAIPLFFLPQKVKDSFIYHITTTVVGFVNKFTGNLWDLGHRPIDILKEDEIKYAQKKRFFSQSLQKTIERNFSLFRNYNYFTNGVPLLKVALNLPINSKIPNKNALHILKNSLSGYTPEIFPQIADSIKEHLRRFSTKNCPNTSPKPILYFQGPPGIGKTFVAEQIAQAMDLNVVKVSLAADNPADIFGSAYGQPGHILQALINEKPGNSRNTVLILDEADHIFNDSKNQSLLNMLLPLLEPSTTHIYNPFLNASIDISHLLIIAIGNAPIENAALASRSNIVHFEGMTPEYKQQIVLQQILPSLLYSENPDYRIDIEQLTPGQWQDIYAIIDEDKAGNLRELQRKLVTYLNQWR